MELNQIESLVREGKHGTALKILRKLDRKQKRNYLVSDLFFRCGSPQDALLCLGAEGTKVETLEQIKMTGRLAFMLSYFDANETATRLLNSALQALSKMKLTKTEFSSTLFRYAATIHLRNYDYESALIANHIAQANAPDSSQYQSILLKLEEADCLDHLGNHSDAIPIATEQIRRIPDSQPVLKAIAYQARGEYYFRDQSFKKARVDFDKAWDLFPVKSQSHDYGFLAKWSGALAIEEKNFKRAKIELDLAQQLFSNQKFRPAVLLEVFHWQIKLRPSRLKDPLYRLLLTHPCRSPFGVLWGRAHTLEEKIETWLLQQCKVDSGDCWSLMPEFRLGHFNQSFVKWITGKTSVLDLQTGVIWQNSKVKDTLSALQANCLRLLFGAGAMGLNIWSLTEKLYPGQWNDPQSTLLRLENLLHQLRMRGYDIKRHSGIVALVKFSQPLLVPFSSSGPSIWPALKCVQPEFKRKDIVEMFSCSDATAKIWIKEALSSTAIVSNGRGKASFYSFNNAHLFLTKRS